MLNNFSKDEIVDILATSTRNDEIFNLANSIRKKYKGDGIHLRGLIEFSNMCKRNCFYCGLRAQNSKIKRYRMLKDEIISYVKTASKNGYKTIVLQSGEDEFYDADYLCDLIKEIKKFDVALTLSIGEKTFEEYKAYKKAGADRYLLRIETTDEKLYSSLHPTFSLENRLKCLDYIKTLNYETGTGSIVGLKGQSIESIADDILFFKKINADMVGIGPFIPNPDTPLKGTSQGDLTLTLKTIALTRILLKDANIPATTAIETINPKGRMLALNCGANVVMLNVATTENIKNYQIYPNKAQSKKDELEKRLQKENRYFSNGFGFRGD